MRAPPAALTSCSSAALLFFPGVVPECSSQTEALPHLRLPALPAPRSRRPCGRGRGRPRGRRPITALPRQHYRPDAAVAADGAAQPAATATAAAAAASSALPPPPGLHVSWCTWLQLLPGGPTRSRSRSRGTAWRVLPNQVLLVSLTQNMGLAC